VTDRSNDERGTVYQKMPSWGILPWDRINITNVGIFPTYGSRIYLCDELLVFHSPSCGGGYSKPPTTGITKLNY